MKLRYSDLRCLVALTVLVTAGQTARSATLSGRVVDQNGAPIANAAVVWWLVSPTQNVPMALAHSSPPSPRSLGNAMSDANGQFQATSIQTGNYGVCVTSIAQPFHLSTCEWRSQAVALAVSETSQAISLVVQSGAVLSFQVSDPKGRLTSQNLSVIVSGANNTGFAHARVTSLTPTSALLTVSVPFNSSITVVLKAPAPVHDGRSASIPLGIPTMEMAISTQTAQTISLTLD